MRRLLALVVLVSCTSMLFAKSSPEALFEAARLGDAKAIKKLLAEGIDVNARNRFGATALWFAAYKNHVEVVKLLLAHKADPEIADNVWNSTPLSLAMAFGQNESAKILLKVTVKGTDGLLIRAAMQGKADLVGTILDQRRPSKEILDSALHLVRATAKDAKERLIKAGAKPFPKPTKADKNALERLKGTYENANGLTVMVVERDGALVAASSRIGPGILKVLKGTTYRLIGEETQLHFELKDNKVQRVTISDVVYEPAKKQSTATVVGKFKDVRGTVREAKNWPSFRGERATGVADGQHPPAVWDAKKVQPGMWKTAIPGLGHSCPVIWGERVFITTAVSQNPKSELKPGLYGALTESKDRTKHQWKVYCLERKTGKILWERLACEGVPRVRRHIKATHANATPATDGKHLVVSFGSEGLYCYSLEGKLLWKQDLGVLDPGAFNDPDIQWESASSPIIHRNLVYMQCDRHKDSYIAAFNLETGKQVWRTPRDEAPSWGTPTVIISVTGAELVANGTTAIRGYDPLTGKELWRLGRNAQITVPTPFMADGMIFVTSGYAPIQPIYAIWPGGRGDLTLKDNADSSEQIAWSKKRGGPYMPTPVYYGGYLFTCSNSGVVQCYEGRTGKPIYKQKLSGSLGYTASPIAGDGKLYFTGEDGKVSVVRAGPKFELLSVNDLGETTLATPAISNGMIFFRTLKHLVGIGWKE